MAGSVGHAAGYDDQVPFTLPPSSTGVLVSASLLHDDNVTRTDSDQLSDESVSLELSDGLIVPFNPYLRAILRGTLALERFDHWQGLSHADLSGSAALQYRPSAVFYAPTFEASVRVRGSDYQSSGRTGATTLTEFSVTQALTDKITAYGALTDQQRRAEAAPFAGHSDGARVHLDYALSQPLTLYASLGHRYGDFFSSSFKDPDQLAIASAHAPDTAFGATARIAYRYKGAADIGAIGANYALSEHQSLDLSFQKVSLRPAKIPYAGYLQATYVDQQLSLSYLVQF